MAVFESELLVILGATNALKQVAGIFFAFGFFCLVGCVAMLMRTGMAKGSGEPIPDDPSADRLTKTGRFIARGERRRVPIYWGAWQLFLGLGVTLLLVALILLLASHL
jgi:hypothetical protein